MLAKHEVPVQPLKFVVEVTMFMLLLVPGILWAGLKKMLPAKQKSVDGQVVLITGAARGLGRELSSRFGGLGAKVVCVDIDETGNDETAKIINDGGGVAVSYKCDVSKRDQIKMLHASVRDEMGPVDIVINNAGIVWGCLFVDPAKDQFIVDQINVNLMAHFWMNREILPSMLERNKGHIVAISSLSSLCGVPGISTYAVSKWGINGMMETLDNELRELNSNVKTTVVLPYFVETNPKISAMLNIRMPEIPTEVASEMVMKGILEEKRIFTVPGHLLTIISFLRLLPDNLQRMFNNIIYVKIEGTPEDQEIKKKYTQKQTNLT